MANRRAFLLGIGAALAAPAVIRTAGLLMPVKSMVVMTAGEKWRRMMQMQSLVDVHVIDQMMTDAIFFGTGAGVFKIEAGAVSHVPYRLIPIDVWNRENA